jgi:hypothetical protein
VLDDRVGCVRDLAAGTIEPHAEVGLLVAELAPAAVTETRREPAGRTRALARNETLPPNGYSQLGHSCRRARSSPRSYRPSGAWKSGVSQGARRREAEPMRPPTHAVRSLA